MAADPAAETALTGPEPTGVQELSDRDAEPPATGTAVTGREPTEPALAESAVAGPELTEPALAGPGLTRRRVERDLRPTALAESALAGPGLMDSDDDVGPATGALTGTATPGPLASGSPVAAVPAPSPAEHAGEASPVPPAGVVAGTADTARGGVGWWLPRMFGRGRGTAAPSPPAAQVAEVPPLRQVEPEGAAESPVGPVSPERLAAAALAGQFEREVVLESETEMVTVGELQDAPGSAAELLAGAASVPPPGAVAVSEATTGGDRGWLPSRMFGRGSSTAAPSAPAAEVAPAGEQMVAAGAELSALAGRADGPEEDVPEEFTHPSVHLALLPNVEIGASAAVGGSVEFGVAAGLMSEALDDRSGAVPQQAQLPQQRREQPQLSQVEAALGEPWTVEGLVELADQGRLPVLAAVGGGVNVVFEEKDVECEVGGGGEVVACTVRA